MLPAGEIQEDFVEKKVKDEKDPGRGAGRRILGKRKCKGDTVCGWEREP